MKTEKTFYQELLTSLFTAMEEMASQDGISLYVQGKRARTSADGSIIKLTPTLYVRSGDISIKVWEISITRTVTIAHFRQALLEIVYGEAYQELLRFVLHNNIKKILSGKSEMASRIDADTNIGAIRAEKKDNSPFKEDAHD